MSLYTSSMNSSESNNYRLRMWVDEDYNPQDDGGNLEFSVQINVYGLDGLSMEDRMMRTAGSADFHSSEYKSKVTNIVTKGDTVIPAGVVESWDISEKQNGSVIAYVEDDGTGAGTYKVTIGGEGKIIANYDMGSYFSGFSNTKSIDLSYLDTSLTTDMSLMFGSLMPNTSLTTIIFGDTFNTSNVTDMSWMFTMCRSLKELDLSEFNTSKVTNMNTMFGYCSSLIKLNINNFDTSNVSSMVAMFFDCSSLVELNINNFNTLKVTSMNQMFQGCSSLRYLDLRSFDTSKVTDYRTMFNGMTNITEILVTKDKWTIPNSTIANSGVTDFTYV